MAGKYTANQIADWFLCNIDRESGESITHLKLQKLIYYAQAWTLALSNIPLFDEDIQAWAHGPVVPSVYQRFKSAGWDALPAPDSCPHMEDNVENLLKEISRVYGKFDAKHLENLTHREAPWLETRPGISPEEGSSRSIPKELMQKFYRKMLDDATAPLA